MLDADASDVAVRQGCDDGGSDSESSVRWSMLDDDEKAEAEAEAAHDAIDGDEVDIDIKGVPPPPPPHNNPRVARSRRGLALFKGGNSQQKQR